MTDFTPQQKEAITTIDKNVAVSAGAGSGKTRVLVERYIYILKNGLYYPQQEIKASDILAITFTRKAAAEMKERVRKTIDGLSRNDDINRSFWKQQLKELEKAQITTIHSLCNRILKENPVEAALDPSFQVVEEFEGQAFLEKCIKDYFRSSLHKGNNALEMLIKNYGVQGTLRQLNVLVPKFTEIIKFGDLQRTYQAAVEAAEGSTDVLCALIAELIERRNEIKKGKKVEELQLAAENLQDILQGIKSVPSDFTAYKKYIGKMRKDSVLKALIAEIHDLQQKIMLSSVDQQALPIAAAWQEIIHDIAEYILQKKIAGDFLTFDDLENLALKLLKNNAHICQKYQQKYRHIMVDEFQDTNDKQKQLVYLLCGGDAETLHSNKLFIVGDPKQSIYRFRGADVSVFAAVRKDITAGGGKEITLADNFRTVDMILDTCNEVFTEFLGVDKERDIYFEALTPHNQGMEKPEFIQIMYDEDTKPLAREAEAVMLAEKILNLHEQGIAYKDMAVLLSAMTKCDIFTHAFDKCNVPYQVIDGKGFYEQQEVLDLINLFTVLHNKNRSLELAGILRSPYFGLDDETITALFLHKTGSCLWDTLQSGVLTGVKEQQIPFVQRSAAILADLRQKTAVLALTELWQEVWQQLQIDAVLSLQENGQGKLGNIKKLQQLAVDFSNGKQGTLASWLEQINNIMALGGRETAANIEADDAVTIMTIHKSKGLEFDTVFLPLLDAQTQNDTDEIKFSADFGLGIKIMLADGQTADTSILQKIKEQDKQLQQAEKYRQLYVAMTRAKSRLIMFGAYNSSKASSSANWFNQLNAVLKDNEVITILKMTAEECLQNMMVAEAEQKILAFDKDFIQPVTDFEKIGIRTFSATSLQTYLHCQRQYFYQYIAQLPALEEVGSGSSALPPHIVGLIIHTALEKYTGDAETAWKAAVISQADGNFTLAESAKKMFTDYLASDLYKNITGRQQRELHFNYNEQDYIITGVIDCLYTKADGSLAIVDYKTGQPPQNGQVNLGYLLQMALYKKAAENLLKQKVSSIQLHFLQNLTAVELSGQEDKYYAAALQLFAEISNKCEESDFSCNTEACLNCQYNYLCPQKNNR